MYFNFDSAHFYILKLSRWKTCHNKQGPKYKMQKFLYFNN
jgi:hypothetical protein